MHYLLSFLIWLPIIGGFFVLITRDDNNPAISRYVSLFIVLLSLGACIPLLMQFNPDISSMQFVEDLVWMPAFDLHYSLGIDGLSLLLIVLSVFTNLVVMLATWNSVQKRVASYFAAFLIMQGLLVGVFSALDSIVFYVFWEATKCAPETSAL